jgi:butyrate kinase
MMLQNQIPKGIRDVVGVEEMMRMSHIMTGANFKSTSLTHKLNRKMKEMKVRKSSIIV